MSGASEPQRFRSGLPEGGTETGYLRAESGSTEGAVCAEAERSAGAGTVDAALGTVRDSEGAAAGRTGETSAIA